MSDDFRLYLICRRADALVASQLPPEEFGAYMATGTEKLTTGRVIFFEVDRAKIPDEAFDIERRLRETVVRPEDPPKRSKYLSIYRSMERIPTEAFGTLYLVTRDGRTLGLEAAEYDKAQEEDVPNMYQELCPLFPLVASSVGPREFLRRMSDPANPLYVPRLMFADMRIDRDEDGGLARYLPYKDPYHIEQCLKFVMKDEGRKLPKTVDRTPIIPSFFRCVRRGFFLGDARSLKFYPYPSWEEMEVKHHLWWRSASLAE